MAAADALEELLPERGHAPWRTTPSATVLRTGRERVLHLRLATPDEPQVSLCMALASLGNYASVDWYGRPYDVVLRELLGLAHETRPSIVFAQVQRGGVLTESLITELRRLCAPDCVMIHWSGDVTDHYHPNGEHWTNELARHVDLMLFSCMTHVRAHRAQGTGNAAYLQVGYDEDRYFVAPSPDRYDVVFLAQLYPPEFLTRMTLGTCEAELRRQLGVAVQSRFGLRGGVFGGGWGQSVRPAQSADVYRASRLAVSASIASDMERYSSDRLLRALACGTAVLCKRFDDFQSWGLQHGENVILFDDVEDMVGLARLYVPSARAGDRARISGEGARLAREHHAWAVRMAEMMIYVHAVRGTATGKWRPW